MFFFFNDTATTEIYTLSLHDALPISARGCDNATLLARVAEGDQSAWRRLIDEYDGLVRSVAASFRLQTADVDRKSTRLNSSHANISYAVFCLKKKKKNERRYSPDNH